MAAACPIFIVLVVLITTPGGASPDALFTIRFIVAPEIRRWLFRAFIAPRAATFMNADDRVIGLMSGKTAKAYPAGILAQHGLVQDDSPTGPIAITW